MTKQLQYCRFCAEQKSELQLMNLITNLEERRNVIKKLNECDISYIDFSIKKLPETICSSCVHILDTLFEFVSKIKSSQVILDNIFKIDISENYHCEDFNKNIDDQSNFNLSHTNDNNQELHLHELKLYDSDCTETWLDYPWICRHCSTKFPDCNTLRIHVKEVHGKCFGFKCVDCSKSLIEFEGFVDHVVAHRSYLMYYCQYCNMKLEDIQTKLIHISEHLTDNFLCNLCGESFASRIELQKHTFLYKPIKLRRSSRRNRPLTVDELTCDICHKVLKSLTILRAHKKLHTDRSREYTCDRCGMMFFTKGALTVHRVIHDEPEPQECLICKKSFLTITRLKKHVKTHNSVKAFECSECHKRFRLKEQLKGHLITHTDLLPYQCQYCKKAFKHKNVLKVHENQHTGARPYSCDSCSMDFANWSNCNKHMKRKHGSTLSKSVSAIQQTEQPLNQTTGKLKKLSDLEDVTDWAMNVLQPCKTGRKTSSIGSIS